MKDWKKEFDEKFKDYVIGFSEDSDYNLELSGFEFYEEFHKELIAFISQVESDAYKKGEEDSIETAHNLMEIVVEKAYERAAKVAEDFYKTAMDFGHEEEVGKRIGPVIRSLKDD